MIVHAIDIRESGAAGLIAVLEAHDFPRAGEAEARVVSERHLLGCFVQGCERDAWSEIVVHRRHSRRLSETAYLCAGHMEAHRSGTTLRLVVESNR